MFSFETEDGAGVCSENIIFYGVGGWEAKGHMQWSIVDRTLSIMFCFRPRGLAR